MLLNEHYQMIAKMEVSAEMQTQIDAKFPTRARGITELIQTIPEIDEWNQKGRIKSPKISSIRYAEGNIATGNSILMITADPIENRIVVMWKNLANDDAHVVIDRSLQSIGNFLNEPAISDQFDGENPPTMLKSGVFEDDLHNDRFRLRSSKITKVGTIEIGDIVILKKDIGLIKFAIESVVGGIRESKAIGAFILYSPNPNTNIDEQTINIRAASGLWSEAWPKDLFKAILVKDKLFSPSATLTLKDATITPHDNITL